MRRSVVIARGRPAAAVRLAMMLLLVTMLVTSCGSDGDDSASSTTSRVTAESPVPADGVCPDPIGPPAPGELSVDLLGPVEFVDGDAPAEAPARDGHTHTGPLVEEGQAHLHYCLGVANGYDHAVALSAILVLPDAEEEPLAVVEAEALGAAFVDPSEAERIAGSDAQVLEILVPSDGPIDELHQRIAYTVEDPAGPLDLFLDVTLPADGS